MTQLEVTQKVEETICLSKVFSSLLHSQVVLGSNLDIL